MPNPVFQDELVTSLPTRSRDDDAGVHQTGTSADSEHDRDVRERRPGRALNRRYEQHGREVDDRRRAEGVDLSHGASPSHLGHQGDDHELQPDQRRR